MFTSSQLVAFFEYEINNLSCNTEPSTAKRKREDAETFSQRLQKWAIPMCLQFADRTIVLFRSNTRRVLLVCALYNRACTNKSLCLTLTNVCGSSYRGAGVFRFNTCTQSLNTRSLNQLHKTTRVLTFYSHTKRDWWAPMSQQTLHAEFRSLHVRGLWKWEVFVYSERGKL